MPQGRRRDSLLGEGDYQTHGASTFARLTFLRLIYQLAPEAVVNLERDNDGRAWAQRFGLDHCAWFVTAAAAQLDMWSAQPATRQHAVWADDGLAGRLVPEPPDIPAWDIEGETEAQFDTRIQAHKAATIAAAKDNGLVPTPELRNPLHLEWLVRHVIKHQTISQIAEHREVSTIQRGINKAADFVGLPMPQ
jgi:hypothetical protein